MKHLYLGLTLLATMLTGFPQPLPGQVPHDWKGVKIEEGAKRRARNSYGNLPLSFEANQGQSDRRVKFLSRGHGYTLFLTPTEAVLRLRKSSAGRGESEKMTGGGQKSLAPKRQQPEETVLRMRLLGSNPTPMIAGLEKLPGHSNYLIGNDPGQWHTDVPVYAKVQYGQVYPGVDLVYYGNDRQMEYDFIVAPGYDPRAIRLQIQGAQRLEINAAGDLLFHVAGATIGLRKPFIYQETNGQRRRIPGGFILRRGNEVAFQVGDYDRSSPLILDPTLVYSTYLGGTGVDYAAAIAVDSSGNVYVTGTTDSINFPLATPLQLVNLGGAADVFVSKMNPTGSALVYSTYLGGNGLDESYGIGVDASGTAYVAGDTDSTNFPTANPLQPFNAGSFDLFVARLNANGSALVYSTYLGGSADDGMVSPLDVASMLAVDAAGNAVLTGFTSSNNFPRVNPLQAILGGGDGDALVAKLNPTGSTLLYSTFLGGSGVDLGLAITIDSAGNAYVTGETDSGNFPTLGPIQGLAVGACGTTACPPDAFVSKINASGSSLMYSTYLGGTGEDVGHDIAVDNAGTVYVAGYTTSTDFPLANALQRSNGGGADAFLAKLNPAGSGLFYSTYLGGSGTDRALGIAVDSSGNAYVTGRTGSSSFPLSNALQTAIGGGFDAFVAMVNPAGSTLLYSTYLGGSGFDSGNGIAVDPSGNQYLAGESDSTNFPTASPFQSAMRGVLDAFVAKLTAAASNPLPRITLISPSSTAVGSAGFNLSVNGANFLASSVVRWSGADRTTRFIDSSLLEASIAAGDLQAAGTAQVTVFNPPPGGGISNSLAFNVTGSSGGGPGPVVNLEGLVIGASYLNHQPAPGSIAAVFGTGLASSTTTAEITPLPTTLQGVTVRMSGIPAPLIAVKPLQIDLQIPWELTGLSSASLTVTAGGITSSPVLMSLGPFSPAIFSTNQQGTGQGAILITGTDAFAAPTGSIPGRNARPVKRGEFISIYCTGLGPVTNQPATGAKATAHPLSVTATTPTVRIGGALAAATDGFFSGLAPDYTGLYQINARVPADSVTGDSVPVVLSIGGVNSNIVGIAVE